MRLLDAEWAGAAAHHSTHFIHGSQFTVRGGQRSLGFCLFEAFALRFGVVAALGAHVEPAMAVAAGLDMHGAVASIAEGIAGVVVDDVLLANMASHLVGDGADV